MGQSESSFWTTLCFLLGKPPPLRKATKLPPIDRSSHGDYKRISRKGTYVNLALGPSSPRTSDRSADTGSKDEEGDQDDGLLVDNLYFQTPMIVPRVIPFQDDRAEIAHHTRQKRDPFPDQTDQTRPADQTHPTQHKTQDRRASVRLERPSQGATAKGLPAKAEKGW